MKFTTILLLSATLIVTSRDVAQAYSGLVLVKGDIPNSCSFISVTELESVPTVQRLLTVRPGSSPEQVGQEIGFQPDQPYNGGLMHWTAVRGGNYLRSVVNFRHSRAFSRSLTMAINYRQPNEKQCTWEVRSPQSIQIDTETVPSPTNGGTNFINYPFGTRIYNNGTIVTPQGQVGYPATTVTSGNGTTTYYYQNGTSITTRGSAIAPSGTFLTPDWNGGIRHP